MRSRTRRTLQAVFRRAHEGHRRHGRKARHQALYDNPRRKPLEAAALHPGTTYWDQNWRKGGLQERRGEILREENFYNQLWCGCEFSMGHLRERDPSDLPAHMKPYLEALGLTGKG